MTKYEPLGEFLSKTNYKRVPMTFENIEKLIHDVLPPSARKHRAWWSNNPSNSVITFAWLNAGYKTANVDMADEKVTFIKREDRVSPKERLADPLKRVGRHPAWGALKGTTIVAEGVDLTQPADPDWGKVYED